MVSVLAQSTVDRDKRTLSGDIGMAIGGRVIRVSDEVRTHSTKVSRWVNFGKVVGKIVATRSPSDSEVTVLNTFADPVVAHIHRFRALEANSIISVSTGGRVVCE